jgi:exopolyphosphatase/guanosine-5'-triphosphate,3'-diphosphate pyrophosphatase
MGRKYQFDESHARLTSRLAALLFDQSRALHNLDNRYMLLLEVGALLHDIGHFINRLDHDKHGYYVLTASLLSGLSQGEQNIVAHLVRYHSQHPPSSADENFKSLPQRDRLIVIKLSALLCLADSLDISHMQDVADVTLRKAVSGWRMKISSQRDPMLVNWAFNQCKSQFREVFGVNLELD